ncbi:leucine-rich repeat flightless-interacting protein 2 [Salarias fasciatus]|uniref:leucine-rich repeat flightless-interacting protein 2 n=1 Tax=Salarias fasciatus TaxID=181472 RepID=UPI001176E2C6|nr:leucine-rich repeat flightless-interacting protein 2-like [Salarias fasciatus]
MLSVTLDSSVSPKKRTLSRGLSEDESLRSIIKETEISSRRLTRSDSRAGTLKRRTDSQSDQDLFMGLPEMLELQASYDEVVQELRGLEVEREALLFQVDVLQDTLEGVEELLAEAQREAGQATLELEQERAAKRRLESMVQSLMQEVERLKEERNSKPPASVNMTDEGSRQELQTETDGKGSLNVGPSAEESGEAGNLLTKLRKMASKPPGHVPSLALDSLASEDGVIQRPCENGIEGGLDPSADTNDTDSISAYEDASAETPEQDKVFPGDGDDLELPDDAGNKDNGPTNGHKADGGESLDGKIPDGKIPDACVMS